MNPSVFILPDNSFQWILMIIFSLNTFLFPYLPWHYTHFVLVPLFLSFSVSHLVWPLLSITSHLVRFHAGSWFEAYPTYMWVISKSLSPAQTCNCTSDYIFSITNIPQEHQTQAWNEMYHFYPKRAHTLYFLPNLPISISIPSLKTEDLLCSFSFLLQT